MEVMRHWRFFLRSSPRCFYWEQGAADSEPDPQPRNVTFHPEVFMLHYSMVFLVFALVAAFLGFWGIAGLAATIAKVCFFVFLVIWLVTLLLGRRSVL